MGQAGRRAQGQRGLLLTALTLGVVLLNSSAREFVLHQYSIVYKNNILPYYDVQATRTTMRATGYASRYIWSKGFGLQANDTVCPFFVLKGVWPRLRSSPCAMHGASIDSGDMVWVQSGHLEAFVSHVLPHVRTGVKFALMTGDDDISVPTIAPNYNQPHTAFRRALAVLAESTHVLVWFAQNICLRYDPARMGCAATAAEAAASADSHAAPYESRLSLSAYAKFVPMPIGMDFHAIQRRTAAQPRPRPRVLKVSNRRTQASLALQTFEYNSAHVV